MTKNLSKYGKLVGFFTLAVLWLALCSLDSVASGGVSGMSGMSMGSSVQDTSLSGGDEIVASLVGNTSFSRLVVNAANAQNEMAGREGAAASVTARYAIHPFAIEDGETSPTEQGKVENQQEYVINCLPLQKGRLEARFLSKVIFEASGDILAYQGKNQNTTHYWLVLELESLYTQNQLVREGGNPAYLRKLEVGGKETVCFRVVVNNNQVSVLEVLFGNLMIMGANDYRAHLNYFGISSAAPTTTFSAVARNENGGNVIPVTLARGTRELISCSVAAKELRFVNEINRMSLYFSNGTDNNLSVALGLLLEASYGQDIGVPKDVSSSDTTTSSNLSSSSLASSFSSSGVSSVEKSSSSGAGGSSSQLISSSSSSSSSVSSTSLTGLASSSSVPSSSDTGLALSNEKNALAALSDKLNTGTGVDALGGSLTGDSKTFTAGQEYMALIDLEKTKEGKVLYEGENTSFDQSSLPKYIFLFGTVLLIMIAVPLAWKFILKNREDEFIG